MNSNKLKYYKLYNSISNAGLYMSSLYLLLVIALLFVPFQKNFPIIDIPFKKGSVGYSSFPFKKEGCFMNLKNVVSKEYSSISDKEGSVLIRSVDRNIYKAYYSPMANLLKINIGNQLAEKVKTMIVLMQIPLNVLVVLVFYLIRKILYSLKKGSPFTRPNARLISGIALILIIVPVIRIFLENLTELYITSLFNLSFLNSFGLDEGDMLCVLGALLFAVLSYVIKQGIEMKEEQDLTI